MGWGDEGWEERIKSGDGYRARRRGRGGGMGRRKEGERSTRTWPV